MNLTKNQIVIVAVLAVGVVAYFMFFRKKPATKLVAVPVPVTPAPAATAESSWAPEYYGVEKLMNGIGDAGGGQESSYDDLSAAPTQSSLAGIGFNTNWLDY